MLPYFTEKYGNPSSLYDLAHESKRAIDLARLQVAKAIGAGPEDIYFTGGGSESDNLAIKGVAKANKNKGNHIITSKIEHMAVLQTCRSLEKEGFEVTYLDVDEYGVINLEQLKQSIKPTTILISIMFANNEIGTIQPIKEIGELAKKNNIYFHTDAVQAIGNIEIDVKELNIDMLSLAAHKFYGPKGVGALYVKKGIKFDPVIHGGHQEKNKRAGTENVPGIVGLGKAIELATLNIDEYNKKLLTLRDKYIKEIFEKIPYVKLNGHPQMRLPGNANISFECVEGESLLLLLSSNGICASSGSACTSGSLDPSHVLLAIGLPHEIAHGSLRITFGEENTLEDVDFVVEKIVGIVGRLRAMSPLWEKKMKQ
jgi:cysteine desulfurase